MYIKWINVSDTFIIPPMQKSLESPCWLVRWLFSKLVQCTCSLLVCPPQWYKIKGTNPSYKLFEIEDVREIFSFKRIAEL